METIFKHNFKTLPPITFFFDQAIDSVENFQEVQVENPKTETEYIFQDVQSENSKLLES